MSCIEIIRVAEPRTKSCLLDAKETRPDVTIGQDTRQSHFRTAATTLADMLRASSPLVRYRACGLSESFKAIAEGSNPLLFKFGSMFSFQYDGGAVGQTLQTSELVPWPTSLFIYMIPREKSPQGIRLTQIQHLFDQYEGDASVIEKPSPQQVYTCIHWRRSF